MDTRTRPEFLRRANCHACNLRGIMACADVSARAIDDFHANTVDLTLERGAPLFRAGATASGVYCIRSGFVKLVDQLSNGNQRIVRIVRRGGVAGMEAVFSNAFEHDAVALEEVVACFIPAADFRRMVDANVQLQRHLFEYSHRALREAEAWLSELAGGSASVRERMARLLLRLRDEGTNRIHRFSLDDVGAMLGITVETACRTLAELTRAGLLAKNGAGTSRRYYKADIDGLERVAGGCPLAPAAAA